MENGLIYKKIIDIVKECPVIGKNGTNDKQKYSFRAIDDVKNYTHDVCAKHGVFWTPEVLDYTREERKTGNGGNLIYSVLKIKYTFWAEDGSSVSTVVVGEGMDSGDKASNKAMSAGEKYALSQVFNIATKETAIDSEDDTHDESVPVPTSRVEFPKQQNQQPKQEQPKSIMGYYPGDEEFLKQFELPKNFQTVLTLADAETMEDSAGTLYGSKSIFQLYVMLDAIQKRIKNNNVSEKERAEMQDKVDAIFILMDDAKKHPNRRKQGG